MLSCRASRCTMCSSTRCRQWTWPTRLTSRRHHPRCPRSQRRLLQVGLVASGFSVAGGYAGRCMQSLLERVPRRRSKKCRTCACAPCTKPSPRKGAEGLTPCEGGVWTIRSCKETFLSPQVIYMFVSCRGLVRPCLMVFEKLLVCYSKPFSVTFV